MSREDLEADAFRHQGEVTVYEPGDATRKITVAEGDLVEDRTRSQTHVGSKNALTYEFRLLFDRRTRGLGPCLSIMVTLGCVNSECDAEPVTLHYKDEDVLWKVNVQCECGYPRIPTDETEPVEEAEARILASMFRFPKEYPSFPGIEAFKD